MDIKTLKPLGTRVIIKQTRTQQTKSGIIIATEAQEKTQEAEVIATGEEVEAVNTGDKIIYDKFAGTELKDGGSEVYTLIEEDDILAVIEE